MRPAYPPLQIIQTMVQEFFPRRGLELAPVGLDVDGKEFKLDEARIVDDIKQFGVMRLDARRTPPRGARDWTVVLVLDSDGKYASHVADLRKLLEGIQLERAAQSNRLDELFVIADDAFFARKNLVGLVQELAERAAPQKRPGAWRAAGDPEGRTPFITLLPYCRFTFVVPDHQAIPAHRLMTDSDVEALLATERLAHADLPKISAQDPPVVWLGGRPGQVVEITRDSQVAGKALYYRRIE